MRIGKISVSILIVFTGIYISLLMAMNQHSMLISDILSPIGALISILLIHFSILKMNKKNKIPWIIFLLSSFSYFIADSIWFYKEIYLASEVPFPYYSDIFYVASAIFNIIAVVLYVAGGKISGIIKASFDVIIAMTVVVTLSLKFIISPILLDSSMTTMQRFVSALYPIADIGYAYALIAFILINKLNRKEIQTVGFLVVSFLMWITADLAYSFMNITDSYIAGGLIDPLWSAGMVSLGVASVFKYIEEETGQDSKVESVTGLLKNIDSKFRIILPYSLVCTLMILVSWRHITTDILVAGAVMAAMLIIVRQVYTIKDNRNLIRLVESKNSELSMAKLEIELRNSNLEMINLLKEKEAQTDFLTGLYNRRFIDMKIKSLHIDSELANKKLSIMLIDVDNFKAINDMSGHSAGDDILKIIADKIKMNVRSDDYVGRYGGDEFIVILPDADIDLSISIGERLCSQVEDLSLKTCEDCRPVTLSIGCSEIIKGELAKDMIKRADEALYMAKREGKNRTIAKVA